MLNDRVLLVTGTSRGIGAASARLLAAHGAAVVGFVVQASRLHSAAGTAAPQVATV